MNESKDTKGYSTNWIGQYFPTEYLINIAVVIFAFAGLRFEFSLGDASLKE